MQLRRARGSSLPCESQIVPSRQWVRVSGTQIYGAEDILKQKLQLVSKSNMVDFAMDISKKIGSGTVKCHSFEGMCSCDLHGPIPSGSDEAAMKARREEVVANLKRLKEECLPLLTVLEDQEKVKQLRTDKQFTFPILAEQYQARPRPAGRGAAHWWPRLPCCSVLAQPTPHKHRRFGTAGAEFGAKRRATSEAGGGCVSARGTPCPALYIAR